MGIMESFVNFLTSEIGQDLLGVLIIALTGGTSAAFVAFKKLITANNINKVMILAVDVLKEKNSSGHEVLTTEIKKNMGKKNESLKNMIQKTRDKESLSTKRSQE